MTKTRKPLPSNVIIGKPLIYNAAIRDRYMKSLVALVNQMADQTDRQLRQFYTAPGAEEYFAQDASIAVTARTLTASLRRKFDQLFRDKAKGLAERMVDETNKTADGQIYESLKSMSSGLSLGVRTFSETQKEIISASITENVSLIKSIPSQYFDDIEGAVMRSITTGRGMQDLVPFLKSHKGITIRRARFIAADQSRKVHSNLTSQKMVENGQDKYIWRHSSNAQEPRPLHVQLNNTIQRISKPPVIQYAKGSQPEVRGQPGELINCSCFKQIVMEFSE